ncbi:MAG: SRPBCC domain-containing protein [Bacteroidetes bacterium]|nr:SRPBCC domain-containing protein [Bacteroidota bacterium]
MEPKTKVSAEDNKQEVTITRDFDLPLHLLFRAFTEAEFIEQWMGTKVLKLESKKHGSYQFETTDPKGNKYGFTGTIHDLIPDEKIIRTFEMERTPFGVQLEIYSFKALTADTSRLDMHVVYESIGKRNQILQLPFIQGINMAHNRIETTLAKLK